jgi:hypothetical protein
MSDDTPQDYYNNTLLLEADIEEEIVALQQQVERKHSTRSSVLALPSSIARECMVPLSKVAFTPGRLVHTNEFSVLVEEGSGSGSGSGGVREWMSHTETAAFLEKDIARVEGDVAQLQEYLRVRRGQSSSSSSTVSGSSSNTVSGSSSSSGDASGTVTREKKVEVEKKKKSSVAWSDREAPPASKEEVDSAEEYVPFAEEIPPSISSVVDQDSDDDDDEWATGPGAGSSGGSNEGFEIREFCDDEGNVLDGQIVDLSKELSNLKTEQEEAKKKHSGSAPEGIDNMINELDQKLNVPTTAVDLDVSCSRIVSMIWKYYVSHCIVFICLFLSSKMPSL